MNIFQANAEKLERLKANVDRALERRNESPQGRADWQEAVRVFHESYDKLAFPGGLNREFELLRVGDPDALEMAVQFLEAARGSKV
jgi:hypothetical protein